MNLLFKTCQKEIKLFWQVLKDEFIHAVDYCFPNLPQRASTLITRHCEAFMMDKFKKSCG